MFLMLFYGIKTNKEKKKKILKATASGNQRKIAL